MNRFIKTVCIILVMAVFLAIPAQAAEVNSARGSSYFGSVCTYLWHVSGTTFEVWFDVTAVRGMDELGASKISIQRSTDNANWTTVQTFNKASTSSMIDTDTCRHASYVTYTGSSGYYYRALVTIYAKDGNNIATDYWYTDTLHF